MSPSPPWLGAVDGIPLTDPVQQWWDMLDLGGEDRQEAADRLREAILDPPSATNHRSARYHLDVARRADDLGDDAAIAVVNPDEDTGIEALHAWLEDLERGDDWISLPTTAAELIGEDRAASGS